jgi:hypothetical protein
VIDVDTGSFFAIVLVAAIAATSASALIRGAPALLPAATS